MHGNRLWSSKDFNKIYVLEYVLINSIFKKIITYSFIISQCKPLRFYFLDTNSTKIIQEG